MDAWQREGPAVAKRMSVDDLVDFIESDIVSGRFAVGAALPGERLLAARHGVGRPLVREAIRMLKARGLLDIEPGRGTYVRSSVAIGRFDSIDLSRRATARQVVESRVIIEAETARLAAERATDSQISLMQACLERFEDTTDHVQRGQLDLTFHLSIARASHNPVLEAVLSSIAPLMVQLMMRSMGDGETARRSHPWHQVCLDAVIRRDGDAAAEAMEAHLRVADDTFGDGYDDPLDMTTNTYARALISSYGSLDNLVDAVLRVER